MKRVSLIVLVFVLAALCGCKDKGFMPEQLLSEQEMISVMTDVQIIEADINRQKAEEHERNPKDTTTVAPKDYIKISRDYYNQLFDHYGISDSIFKQNMRYYTERPDVLERIMDSVINRLSKEQSTSSAR